MIFIFSGISFVRERTQGTVERLMVTPVKNRRRRPEGTSADSAYSRSCKARCSSCLRNLVFKMPFAGPWWLAGIIMLLIAFIAVMFGIAHIGGLEKRVPGDAVLFPS